MLTTGQNILRGMLCVSLSVNVMSWFVGCQALGLKNHDDMAFLNEDDDWAIPKRASNQAQRPKISDLNSSEGKQNINPANVSRYDLRNQIAKENDLSSPSKSSDFSSQNQRGESKKPGDQDLKNIADTQQTELDVDGALEALPAPYRDVLKKQLASVQMRSNKTQIAATDNSQQDSDSVTQAIAKREVASETQNNTAKPGEATAQIAEKDSPKKAITVRMSDMNSELEKPQIAVSNTKEPEPMPAQRSEPQAEVATAVATSLPANNDPMASQVVQATSLLPIVKRDLPTTQNQPPLMNNSQSANWRQNVAQAIENLEKLMRETPSTDENLRMSQEITLRMLYLSQRRLDDAVKPIENLSDREQEFLRHEMLALYEASNPDAMPVKSRHWSLVMNSQRDATNALAAVSNLEVKSLAFCTEVERFGVITKFPKYAFQADQEVLLYCEIENVAAEKVRNGFETQLQGSYEIIDAQNRKIADQLLPMEPEICQNHRRDYFIVYKIYMPQQIASGNYQLKLTIEDLKGRKFGQSQVDFQIKK